MNEEKCFFCKSDIEELVTFHEHYRFCPDCSAIYTIQTVVEGCEHLRSMTRAVIPERLPWYKEVREEASPYVIDREDSMMFQCCSKCKADVILDGW